MPHFDNNALHSGNLAPMTTLRQSIADWAKQWSTRTRAELRAIRRYPLDVRFRIFQPADEDACLEIYQSLESGFPANGTDNFLTSLRSSANSIVVAERDGTIVGMGGISLSGKNTATLWYGLVAPAHQGSGIGIALALLRLCSLPSDDFAVFIYTLHRPEGFYRRLGFQTFSQWDDEHGCKHPFALLDLAGFRRDLVLDILRTRGVALEGTLVPRLGTGYLIDRFRLNNGTYEFKARPNDTPEGAS
jgi:predicted N-acetyltransferase YhbS